MKQYKTQLERINDAFIGVTVVIIAATLVASGLAVSKVNTEYMETGIKAEKIIAERENEEIFFSLGGRKFSPPKKLEEKLNSVALYLPAPLNGMVYIADEIFNLITKNEP